MMMLDFHTPALTQLQATQLAPGKVLFEKAGVCHEDDKEGIALLARNWLGSDDFEIVPAASVGLRWINDAGGVPMPAEKFLCVIVNAVNHPQTP